MNVYIIECNEHYKIGLANDPKKRIVELQVGNPEALKLRWKVKYQTRRVAQKVEKEMHVKFKEFRKRGEWFAVDLEVLKLALLGCELELQERAKIVHAKASQKRYTLKSKKDFQRQAAYLSIRSSTEKVVVIDKRNLLCLLTRGVGLPSKTKKLLEIGRDAKKGWMKGQYGKTVERSRYLDCCDPSLK